MTFKRLERRRLVVRQFRQRFRGVGLWSVLVSLLCAVDVCAGTIRVQDVTGHWLALEHPARRVVSLAPHITETVYAAGAGETLIGAVSYSDYPEAAKSLPRVGSYDKISLESLVALQPDLVLAWRSGNGDDVVSRLRGLGFPVFVQEPKTLESVAQSIRDVGVLTGQQVSAEAAADLFTSQLQQLRQRYSGQQPLSVYYQIWNEPLLTLNKEHLISDVVRLCGGRNVFADAVPMVSRISVESVLAADPQVIIASGMDQARPEWLDDWRQWRSLQAVSHDQLYFVPPDILQRHTPRIILGAQTLCAQLQQARDYYAAD